MNTSSEGKYSRGFENLDFLKRSINLLFLTILVIYAKAAKIPIETNIWKIIINIPSVLIILPLLLHKQEEASFLRR